ncbi:MAG: trimethylamine methyltransferase family protein, partial [Deltaproteobacteria bacterium]|nr:trimethylamine methyltransferase family protein [Deltaproteobacteria bacterium]
CDRLEHLDFFIRPLNIQDDDINCENHDVNKFFASLNNITKHVQAGLTCERQLDNVIKMAEIIAGGSEELRENPIISFIACLFKSPLQIVDDTADKVFEIVESGLPLVMSSSPQGGSSAPVQEAGLIAQINAEILAGVTLVQLIEEGAPVLYGSVPVRARFDTHNIDCVQMARYYKVPCYSSAGVGDAKIPGMQATFEKMLTQLFIAMSGPQYIHYAFGLLDRTNTFSPLQAVLDNEQIGKVKHCLRSPKVDSSEIKDALKIVKKVMASKNRLFTRHVRKALHAGDISSPYLFESSGYEDQVIERAAKHMENLEAEPAPYLDTEIVTKIFDEVPGILPSLKTT